MYSNESLKTQGINTQSKKEFSSDEMMRMSFGEDFDIKMLDSIEEEYSDILKYEFGMQDGVFHSIEEIAEKYNMSYKKAKLIDFAAKSRIKKLIQTKRELNKCVWTNPMRKYR